jgi:hypothetical protein
MRCTESFLRMMCEKILEPNRTLPGKMGFLRRKKT